MECLRPVLGLHPRHGRSGGAHFGPVGYEGRRLRHAPSRHCGPHSRLVGARSAGLVGAAAAQGGTASGRRRGGGPWGRGPRRQPRRRTRGRPGFGGPRRLRGAPGPGPGVPGVGPTRRVGRQGGERRAGGGQDGPGRRVHGLFPGRAGSCGRAIRRWKDEPPFRACRSRRQQDGEAQRSCVACRAACDAGGAVAARLCGGAGGPPPPGAHRPGDTALLRPPPVALGASRAAAKPRVLPRGRPGSERVPSDAGWNSSHGGHQWR
mmetsp:Transcript_91782/g.283859  ORF Transcript_91782/g.283859 Transcript_91782/m.283859 type:complete len:263 (+) Transcript_91782:677-1465(+)